MSDYNELHHKATLWDNITTTIKKKQFSFKDHVARRLIGLVLSYAPMMSWISASKVFTLLLQLFFSQFKIPVKPYHIARSSPSRTTFTLFLSIDAANKKGMHYVVKVISFCDTNEDDLFVFELDSNGCNGINVDTADSVIFSIKHVDEIEEEIRQLFRLCSDSGGGGVRDRLKKDLNKLKRIYPDVIQCTCTLHALSLMLANPVTKYMGLGKLNNNTPIQLLCLCYYYNTNIVQPVLTHWEYVGQASSLFIK